jgi:hypothetical protein
MFPGLAMISTMDRASSTPPPHVSSGPPEAYFRELEQAFARAQSGIGETRDFTLNFDGVVIRLRFIGDALPTRLLPTLAHLQAPATSPVDYTICCWDDRVARSALPPPAAWMQEGARQDSLPVLTDARFRTFYVPWFPLMSAIDLVDRTAYCCYSTSANLLMYEVSSPLRGLLNAILNQRGMQIVHASAVGTPEGSVLIAGAAFSGKSTLAMMALQDGLAYQSDDLCVLTAEAQPRSLCLYNIAKLREDMQSRFPVLQPLLTTFEEGGERKGYFYVHEHFSDRVMKAAPVRALVLSRIVDEPISQLTRASRTDAVRELVYQSMREIPTVPGPGERILLQALSRLPLWQLSVGRDGPQTLALIRQLLAGA